jgi:hypothetical protein
MVEHFVKAALWHLTQEEGAAPGEGRAEYFLQWPTCEQGLPLDLALDLQLLLKFAAHMYLYLCCRNLS